MCLQRLSHVRSCRQGSWDWKHHIYVWDKPGKLEGLGQLWRVEQQELVRTSPNPSALSQACLLVSYSSALRGQCQPLLEKEGKTSCHLNIHSYSLASGPEEKKGRQGHGHQTTLISTDPSLPFPSPLYFFSKGLVGNFFSVALPGPPSRFTGLITSQRTHGSPSKEVSHYALKAPGWRQSGWLAGDIKLSVHDDD